MFKIGLGYDVHRFVKGRDLYLGGVKIPHTDGLDGHSDADVVLHAICDAILGALPKAILESISPITMNATGIFRV
jgi:2-C-methyl-D-erythritol 2,4-cyclodiphosphate synthase